MEQSSNSMVEKWLCRSLGLLGGGIKFTTLQTEPAMHFDFWQKLIPSVVTAALCALAGLLIKEIYNWVKKYIKSKLK